MLPASSVNPRLQDVIDRIDELPTLPGVVIKLMEMINDENTSVSEISQLISTDPALMMKLLKMANSSFYGFSREISTVEAAIVSLGLDQLRNLSLSLSVIMPFPS